MPGIFDARSPTRSRRLAEDEQAMARSSQRLRIVVGVKLGRDGCRAPLRARASRRLGRRTNFATGRALKEREFWEGGAC